jgi:hypothetical protein
MQQYPTWCSNGPNMLDTTMLGDVGTTCCIRLNRPLGQANDQFLAYTAARNAQVAVSLWHFWLCS